MRALSAAPQRRSCRQRNCHLPLTGTAAALARLFLGRASSLEFGKRVNKAPPTTCVTALAPVIGEPRAGHNGMMEKSRCTWLPASAHLPDDLLNNQCAKPNLQAHAAHLSPSKASSNEIHPLPLGLMNACLGMICIQDYT